MSESNQKWETRGSNIHNFDNEPVVIGVYKGTTTRGEKDAKFDVLEFQNSETGAMTSISAFAGITSIIKKMTKAKDEPKGQLFRIEFIEMSEYKGKKFRVFDVATAAKEA